MIAVLYIDDEPALLEVGKLFLERTSDCVVDTVLSGQEALARLGERQYDAIIADYQMPGMDGITLLKKVRAEHGNLPFILFTGKGREDVVIDAINNGADFYLQKGGDPTAQFAELAHKVRQAVSRWRAEESRRLNNIRLEAMLRLYAMRDLPLSQITDYALEAAVTVTGSAIGYLAFTNEDETVLTMYSWSKSAMEECRVAGKFIEYPVHTTGLWGEAVRQRRPIITNDYAAKNPLKKGIPEGHVSLIRHMNVPVFDGQRIVIVAGVGNKKADYTEDDASQLSLLMGELWGIIRGRKTEESVRMLAEMLDTAPGSITVHDSRGKFLYANRKTFEIHGYDRDGFMSLNVHDVDVPESEALIEERVRQVEERGEASFEVAHFKKDGTRIPLEVFAKKVEWNGAPAILSIATDITERRQRTEALRKSEDRNTALLAAIPDLIFILNKDGVFIDYNAGNPTELLIPPEYFLQRHITGVLPPDLACETEERLKTLFATGQPQYYEYSLEVRGELQFYESRMVLCGEDKALSMIRNISGRRRMERALLESEEKYRIVAEQAKEGIAIVQNGRLVFVNPYLAEMSGYPIEELRGALFVRFVAPESVPDLLGIVKKAILGEPVPAICQTRIRHRDGHLIEIEASGTPVTWRGSRALLGIIRDVTWQKQAESRLKESETRFRTLADMLPQIIFEIDREGRVRYANRQAFEMLLVSREDLTNGIAGLDFIAEQERSRAAATISEILAGKPKKGGEYRIRRRDGTEFPGLIFTVPIMQGGSISGLRGMIIDITERKQMEEALRETSEKLRILTGITRHDIQNKTMILRAYLAQALQTGDLEKMKDYLARADAVAQNVEDIAAFAKTYEEIGGKEPVWLDLNRIVTDEAASAGTGSCELVLPAEGYEIFVDRLFGRVFHNLIENTLRHSRTATRITVSLRESGDCTVILYEDNGIGIAAGDKEQIFEKGVGKGTGLGLFLIRQILAITGITIRETGEPGTGARFEMAFPPGYVRRRKTG